MKEEKGVCVCGGKGGGVTAWTEIYGDPYSLVTRKRKRQRKGLIKGERNIEDTLESQHGHEEGKIFYDTLQSELK